jgi:DNA-binding NarL/FixJ family response regulator
MIRVLLVEDHILIRAGLRALLEIIPEVEVAAEASDGLAAVQLYELHKPDVTVMDISMPGLSGIEAAGRILKQSPGARILLLSMHATEEYMWQALRMGVKGYMLKDAEPSELALALRTVARDETYLSPAVSRHFVEYVRRSGDSSPQARLTPRQREILQLIAEGYSTQQIAQRLHISVKTAETHRAQLMERLQIRDIAGLVRYAIRIGLVTTH